MLYVLHGSDIEKGKDKLRGLTRSLQSKKPDASFFRIDDESFDTNQLTELMEGQGLFENKYIIVFDRVFANVEAKEVVLKNLAGIALSQNIFILFEGKIDKKTVTRLEKRAEKTQVFEEKKAGGKEEFNIFSLTDALGRRDRKNLWVLYRKAKQEGISDEEIHGILFWQVKSMLLSNGAKNSDDAGLNPFVYRKSLQFLKNYTDEEVKKLSSSLVFLSHDARRGLHEFDIALERFILGV
ncbi:hypothetical protein IIB50_00900 [Patescibacteria group bacterium]|nr:hypothetical protein [Patescibacteria group bacterium]